MAQGNLTIYNVTFEKVWEGWHMCSFYSNCFDGKKKYCLPKREVGQRYVHAIEDLRDMVWSYLPVGVIKKVNSYYGSLNQGKDEIHPLFFIFIWENEG